MKKVFFPGSFNPFTKGHADIVCRLLDMADSVCIGIGMNIDKPETASLAQANARKIEDWIARNNLGPRVEVTVYSGLSAEEALKRGAQCMARGVRSALDFDYEYTLSSVNRKTFGIETILLPSDPALSYVSSTTVRDLINHGRKDLAQTYLP